MKNKLIFRILGALSSSLIIVAIFIPFISASGYSQSIWEAYEISSALYLPIMIIVFGAIGVLTFSLNIKTEFAYSTSGAILFYLISETISFVKQDMFSSLSVGYYCLVIGTLGTAIMAFISNLKSKKIKELSTSNQNLDNSIPILNQIDMLYNDTTSTMQPQNSILNNNIKPLPITNDNIQLQEIESLNPAQQFQPMEVSNVVQQSQPMQTPSAVSQPMQNSSIVTQPIQNSSIVTQPVASSISNESNNATSNPVVAEFELSAQQGEPAQPFFASQNEDQSLSTPQQPGEFFVGQSILESSNPVLSAFENEKNKILSNPETLDSNNVSNINNNNNSNLDIFK